MRAIDRATAGEGSPALLGFDIAKPSVSVASEHVIVHEPLHAAASAVFRTETAGARMVFEGVTEHFARRVVLEQAAQGGTPWPDHGSYPEPVRLAQKLRTLVTPATLHFLPVHVGRTRHVDLSPDATQALVAADAGDRRLIEKRSDERRLHEAILDPGEVEAVVREVLGKV